MTWPIDHNGDSHEESFKVPLSTLYRWFLYDVAGEKAKDFNKVFELSPVSEEGDEKEQEDSDNRVAELEPLLPFIQLYSSITSEYAFEVHKHQLLKMPGITEDMLENTKESLTDFYTNMVFAGMISILSASIALNLLKPSDHYPELREGELDE